MHLDLPRPADQPPPAASAADRRLFRRYAAGLPALIAGRWGALPCRIADISLGGACVVLDAAAAAALAPGEAELSSPEMAGGYAFPVAVRHVLPDRAHLSFDLDDRADFELTMFLMDSPATLEGLEPG